MREECQRVRRHEKDDCRRVRENFRSENNTVSKAQQERSMSWEFLRPASWSNTESRGLLVPEKEWNLKCCRKSKCYLRSVSVTETTTRIQWSEICQIRPGLGPNSIINGIGGHNTKRQVNYHSGKLVFDIWVKLSSEQLTDKLSLVIEQRDVSVSFEQLVPANWQENNIKLLSESFNARPKQIKEIEMKNRHCSLISMSRQWLRDSAFRITGAMRRNGTKVTKRGKPQVYLLLIDWAGKNKGKKIKLWHEWILAHCSHPQ